MSPIFTTLAPGLFEAGAKLIDRLIPDPAQREQAKLALFQAEGQQALQEMQVSLSAILAEANSLSLIYSFQAERSEFDTSCERAARMVTSHPA